MQSFKDDMRPALKGLTLTSFDRERALALYPDQDTLDSLLEKDHERFQTAIVQAGGGTDYSVLTEPVNALTRRFMAEITLALAAAEAGLEPSEFRGRIRAGAQLRSPGFEQLLVPEGFQARLVGE